MQNYEDQDVSQACAQHNFWIWYRSLFLRTRINDNMKFFHHVARTIVKFYFVNLSSEQISILISLQITWI